MTEFKKLMIEKGLSNKAAMKLFYKTERTITRWRNGDVETPELVMEKMRSLPSKEVGNYAKAS